MDTVAAHSVDNVLGYFRTLVYDMMTWMGDFEELPAVIRLARIESISLTMQQTLQIRSKAFYWQ